MWIIFINTCCNSLSWWVPIEKNIFFMDAGFNGLDQFRGQHIVNNITCACSRCWALNWPKSIFVRLIIWCDTYTLIIRTVKCPWFTFVVKFWVIDIFLHLFFILISTCTFAHGLSWSIIKFVYFIHTKKI